MTTIGDESYALAKRITDAVLRQLVVINSDTMQTAWEAVVTAPTPTRTTISYARSPRTSCC